VSRHGLTITHLVDDDGKLFRHFGVPAQPAWTFVEASGQSSRTIGALGESALTARLDQLTTR
jgi:hypothetical protein